MEWWIPYAVIGAALLASMIAPLPLAPPRRNVEDAEEPARPARRAAYASLGALDDDDDLEDEPPLRRPRPARLDDVDRRSAPPPPPARRPERRSVERPLPERAAERAAPPLRTPPLDRGPALERGPAPERGAFDRPAAFDRLERVAPARAPERPPASFREPDLPPPARAPERPIGRERDLERPTARERDLERPIARDRELERPSARKPEPDRPARKAERASRGPERPTRELERPPAKSAARAGWTLKLPPSPLRTAAQRAADAARAPVTDRPGVDAPSYFRDPMSLEDWPQAKQVEETVRAFLDRWGGSGTGATTFRKVEVIPGSNERAFAYLLAVEPERRGSETTLLARVCIPGENAPRPSRFWATKYFDHIGARFREDVSKTPQHSRGVIVVRDVPPGESGRGAVALDYEVPLKGDPYDDIRSDDVAQYKNLLNIMRMFA